jgi:hypothetical protein
MGRFWPVAAIAIAFGGIGLPGALKSSRGESAAAADVPARLDAVPLAFGDWAGTVNVIPPKHLQIAEAQAHMSRTDTHKSSRRAVSVMLLSGEPGPLGAHAPETCYVGAGYRQFGAAVVRDLAGAEVWAAKFETAGDAPVTLNVNWAWGTGDGWKASDNPRFDFAGHSRIDRPYASDVVPSGEGPGRAPADDFVPTFLAEVRARLAAADPPLPPCPLPPGVGGQK